MIRQLKSMEEFYEYFRRIQESFSSNKEYGSPTLDKSREYLGVERVDLRQLPDRAVVFLKGMHLGEDYRIRVDDTGDGRVINIWRNIEANGLVAPLESIASTAGGLAFEEGVIIRKSQVVVPYFRYTGVDVEKPADIGMSSPVVLLVQYAK